MWDKHIFNTVMLKTAVVILECKFACSDRPDFPHNFFSLKHDKYQKPKILIKINSNPKCFKTSANPAHALCSVLCLFKKR